MNVLFVHSLEDAQSVEHPLASLEDIQIGISYISAVLKRQGHATRLAVLSPTQPAASYAIVERLVREFQPRVIGFTAVFSQYPFLAQVARFVRARWPAAYLIVGGPHASLNAAAVIGDAFDAVCVSEGEQPMAELVRQLEAGQAPRGIPNLWLKQPDGRVERGATRAFHDNLDELPFPDRDMWLPWLKEKAGARLSVLLGRGCPFQCTYCSNHALAKLAPGRYVRMRSPENILAEIRELTARFPGKNYIYLEVETITVNKPWLFELSRQLAAFNATLPAPIAFGCNFRVTAQSIDEDLFAALARANFVSLNIGLESGSERVRREILKRNYSNEDMLKAAALARRHGMAINLYVLIGIPGETPADFAETVRMTRLVNPGRAIKSIFFPYPGTELGRVCEQAGYDPRGLDVSRERRRAALDLPTFPRRRVQHAYTWFEYHVYRGQRPLPELLIRTARNTIKATPWMDRIYLKLVQIPLLDRLRAKGESSVNAMHRTAPSHEPQRVAPLP